ncbi:helix-turn-helix transcriptional regulator [Hymenobacter lucidus]|uniref:Helix-turn-helix domain-containing protein n=1 Tax=Hymenobacter lucidus TaxID=2880930 RepID=A0ABS8APS8_9BACT|nr:helix-turn-helix domain-containing protein [Hymenobacter lucidus]MCB2407424.1 helix-turn-helix domain-containing protein [Hymenobacter lucidus]
MAISPPAEPVVIRVRTYFGLSQQELARFLGVSRALVALVETGRRTLPAEAATRLAILDSGISEEAATPVEVSRSALATWEPLQLHQRKCLRQASGLRQELLQLQTQAAQYQRRLQALPLLSQALGQFPADAELQAWLEQLATEARYGLFDCGTAAQTLLTVRITALEFEAAEAYRQLGLAS